jgi:hypothetical protein
MAARKKRQKHIPTPVKLYLRQFLGDEVLEKPLTEKYFQPEELKAINLLIEQSRDRTKQTKNVGKRVKPEWAYTPRDSAQERLGIKAPVGFRVPSEWIREHTYNPKGAVAYGDYDKIANLLGYYGGQRPKKAVKQFSKEDPLVPYQSVMHTLGQFNYEEVTDPDTGEVSYKVTDVYDWDPIYGPSGIDPASKKEGKGRYPEWGDLPNIIAGRKPKDQRDSGRYNYSSRLANLAEWAGAKFGPRASEGEGIKFRVNIPKREYDSDYSAIDEILEAKSSKKGGRLKHTKKRKRNNNKIINGKIMYGYKAGGKV